VIWTETGETGLTEYVRRLVFNALIGNADMHLKNWSLIYREPRTAALAPGYDFVSTIAFLPDEKMALNFGHSKLWKDLSLSEVMYFANKAKLPEMVVVEAARETVRRFRDVWKREKKHLPLDAHTVREIERHAVRIPLVKEIGK
jgi:serine/threonine-protein kinase HipA